MCFFRKGSYLTCAILFVIGSLAFQFCRAASSVELLIIGRFLVGLASGITTTCLPMYLSEIAPLHLRGTLGVFCSMGITGGVVVGQIFSLQEVFGTRDSWHYALSFQILFLVICTLPYRIFPESPKYLYSITSDRTGAMRELKKLCDTSDMALDEFETMEPTNESTDEKYTLLSVLTDPKLLLPLVLVCAMQGGQQLSGINAVSLTQTFLINCCLICLILGLLLFRLDLRIHWFQFKERQVGESWRRLPQFFREFLQSIFDEEHQQETLDADVMRWLCSLPASPEYVL